MKINQSLQVFYLLFLVPLWIGFNYFYVKRNLIEPQQCVMYWIRPVYIPVQVKHPLNFKYKLFLYRENSEDTRLNGKPLLFVHGNAGSHKQVRSIGGSVEFKWQKDTRKQNLDVFVIDFNEEFSGVQGNVLPDQTDFVVTCINFILNDLYKGTHKSMITIGHSIGGLVLRGSLLNPHYKNGTIDLIITWSTPHQKHGFIFDLTLSNYYDKVNEFWRNNSDINIPILSISGGYRDVLVTHENTLLNDISPHTVSISSYEIEDVLFSMDHYCITWCKQFIDRLGSIIFELINTKDLTIDQKIQILKKIKESSNIPLLQTKESISIKNTSKFISTNSKYEILNLKKNQRVIILSNQYFSVYRDNDLLKTNNLPFIRVDSENELVPVQPNNIPRAYSIFELVEKISVQTLINSRNIIHYFDPDNNTSNATFYDLLFKPFQINDQTGFINLSFPKLKKEFPYRVRIIKRIEKDYFLLPIAILQNRVFENATEFVIKNNEKDVGINFQIFIDPEFKSDIYLEISWMDLISNIFRYHFSSFVILLFSFTFFYLSTDSYHLIFLTRVPLILAIFLNHINILYSLLLVGFSFSFFVLIHSIVTFFPLQRKSLKKEFYIISILAIFTNSGIFTFISFLLLYSSNESVLMLFTFLIQAPSLLSLKDFIKFGYGINQENIIAKILVILLYLDLENFEKTKKWKFDVIGFFILIFCLNEIPKIYYSFGILFILNKIPF